MATGTLSGLVERAKSLASGFGTYSAFGSFLLYVLGYLALRFHLTALGVGTDLAILDERYLFAGANFLIYIGTTLPIALLAGAFLAGLVYGPYRLLPSRTRQGISGFCRRQLSVPGKPATLGIVLALVMIQLFMRKCFFFTNLLVKPGLPSQTSSLNWLLDNDGYLPLYFSGLLLGLLLPLALWAWPLPEGTPSSLATRWKRALLGVLIGIQALLLPMNYGVLVLNSSLPQITTLGDEPLPAGDTAWLVWEGKETLTCMVKRGGERRSLVAVPRAESKRIEIVGYAKLPDLLRADPPTTKEPHAKP